MLRRCTLLPCLMWACDVWFSAVHYRFLLSLLCPLQTIASSVCAQKGSTSCFNNYNIWCIIFG